MKPRFLVFSFLFAAAAFSTVAAENELERAFAKDVRPFLESYCVTCHDRETRKAQLDLSAFETLTRWQRINPHWDLVLERLRNSEMPPKKAKAQPSAEGARASLPGSKNSASTKRNGPPATRGQCSRAA